MHSASGKMDEKMLSINNNLLTKKSNFKATLLGIQKNLCLKNILGAFSVQIL
jgi:hypothetical protein